MDGLKIYNFMKFRGYALVFSTAMLVISVWSLATKGLVLGLDFSGGTQIEVGYDEPVNVSLVREELESVGFENPVVVHFGAETEVLIRLQGQPDQELAQEILAVLKSKDANVDLRRIDFVGPQIGEELREDGGLGMLTALIIVMIYVAIRFQLKFSAIYTLQ